MNEKITRWIVENHVNCVVSGYIYGFLSMGLMMLFTALDMIIPALLFLAIWAFLFWLAGAGTFYPMNNHYCHFCGEKIADKELYSQIAGNKNAHGACIPKKNINRWWKNA